MLINLLTRSCPLICYLLCAGAISFDCRADIVTARGANVEVTQIRSDFPGTNYGADPVLIVGRTTTPAVIRGLLSFNLSSIPPGSIVTSVTLMVYAWQNDLLESVNGS